LSEVYQCRLPPFLFASHDPSPNIRCA
jgi:hypothetical protein